ncbi:MAG: DNA-directed RNA polymerase subunit alpha [Patescibacteria group bacterium]|nr:MAG: DNA-directed RNA polymerase subunit alpha [Patescibacteria group bacterium]
MLNVDFETKIEKKDNTYAKFSISPLPQSFGHSMGLALRRTLLSSIPGYAVVEVEIKGVTHQFETIKGVKESVLDIILNLKELYVKAREDEVEMSVSAKGVGKILAKDLQGDADVVNKDLVIAEITDPKTDFDMKVRLIKGVGHRFAEDIKDKRFGVLYVDAFFSPIKKVNFTVEEARKGRDIAYDKLNLEVWTDGSIEPEEAVKLASNYLADHFSYLLSGKDEPKEKEEKSHEEIAKEQEIKQMESIIIDELNLPSRIINALLREKIETVADLVKYGKDKLETMKGLGKKSVQLIEEELDKLGFKLE